MRLFDVFAYAYGALGGYRTRSLLMMLAIAIGVGAVIFLTALGEGARRYVTNEFTALGTHLLIVLPGRSETTGGHPPVMGETPRDLTLEDALALTRSRQVKRVAPVVLGAAPVSSRARDREVTIIGTTAAFFAIRHLEMAHGRPLNLTDPRRTVPICVMGGKVKRELFGHRNALGQWVRIGERRFRVVGLLGSEGRSLGLDLEEVVVIPVSSAQALFNTPSLFRVLVQARSQAAIPRAKSEIRDIIRGRHEGEEDITVITQDALIGTFDRIFHALTLTVAGIAAISLAVAGILIMNVMLIAVTQRTPEIGLLKALGAPAAHIQVLFLTEAGLLSLIGAGFGLGVGLGATWLLRRLYPLLPATPPLWAVCSAIAVAIALGLLFALLPAKRAASLDPVLALASR